MDMGTGDGRYVAYVARHLPERFVIGIDTCRENLQKVSKKSLPNALYLIANAGGLPVELSKEPGELCNDRLYASRFQLHFSRVLYTF
jgi:tRNA G46 methylase TrmB